MVTDGGRPAPIKILGNWIIQGLFYKDKSEMIFGWVLELSIIAVLALVIALFLEPVVAVLFAIVMAHTFMWLFNGHFWALALDANLSHMTTGRESLIAYAFDMSSRLQSGLRFDSMLVYGSVARNEAHNRSDLDVVVICPPGTRARIIGCSIVTRERILALLRHFPLDIHMLDSDDSLRKMRRDEIPVVLFRNRPDT